MTALTAFLAADMTTWDLTDLAGGTTVTNTSTDWDVTGFGGTNFYEFGGTGFTYTGGGNPQLKTGLIQDFALTESSVLSLTIVGDISAKKFMNFVALNDVIGLQKLWFKGNDDFTGSADSDHLIGYDGKDTFDLSAGGDDSAEGRKANDTFIMEDALSSGDSMDGGDGTDTMTLNGDYFFVFGATTLIDVEKVVLAAGHDYELTFDPANIGAGGLNVDGDALGNGEDLLLFLNSGNKAISVQGGRGGDLFVTAGGRDTLDGGRNSDFINGGGDGDTLTGGLGGDRFIYFTASQSTGLGYDTITDLDVSASDLIAISHVFDSVNTPLTTGNLSTATFDADLQTAITAAVMGKSDAVLFSPDSGDYVGETFLIVDMNDKDAYQANKDIVILVTGMTGTLDNSDFTPIG
jgi:hypothetical protein